MHSLHRLLRLSVSPAISRPIREATTRLESLTIPSWKPFSSKSGDGGNQEDSWSKGWENVGSSTESKESSDFGWDSVSSWSTGLTKEHFDGEAVGRQVSPGTDGGGHVVPTSPAMSSEDIDEVVELEKENRRSREFVDGWNERMKEMSVLLKQVREPGSRGSYLKDSEKAEMYKLHKENPEVYTIEKLAKDYRIMRQRVHAILWLKELEEEEEKKLGQPLDDSVELLLDACPEFFNSHDMEFHVASLPYKPDFKVMPEGWDGTARDPDEVHYDISMKEDELLYQEFLQKLNFNKKKVAGEVKCHKYSRRRPSEGWNFTVEKLGKLYAAAVRSFLDELFSLKPEGTQEEEILLHLFCNARLDNVDVTLNCCEV
ncbi:hypothetical protein NE237_032870 [Protea cynaroides]|uniref:Ribosomal protein S35 n=1 Tax=Protea cynaroides TaxID=273540 RepID=A0A9Q0R3H4_9MAGN|nr:hypothetical protein NE237_032870 [Protea cynaroides]